MITMLCGKRLGRNTVVLTVLLSAWGGWSQAATPTDAIGPQTEPVDTAAYQHILSVAPGGKFSTVSDALGSITDASASNRYAVLVAGGHYMESGIQMKSHVDLFGGFDPADPKNRDIEKFPSLLDAQLKGPVVLGANDSRLDGFVITGGEHNTHGGGIICDGVSPTISNNVIRANHTSQPKGFNRMLYVQIGSEGGGLALLGGSRSLVTNNLFFANTTDVGAGAGMAARGGVKGKIVNNVFCNNTSGMKDDGMRGDHLGSRSSPGASLAVSEDSSPLIASNVIVLGDARNTNDSGGLYIEDNSTPLVRLNQIVGNRGDDDGGGIYVMGDAFFGEDGVRHSQPPAQPVNFEDNLIAGNHAVKGGPGALRLSKDGRANTRHNLIVGNIRGGAGAGQKAEFVVRKDDIEKDNDSGDPQFRRAGNITRVSYGPGEYVTILATDADLGSENLAGEAIRIGENWSVVKSNDANSLTVWGRIAGTAKKFGVLADYGWRPNTDRP